MRLLALATVVTLLLPVSASAQGSQVAYVGQVSYAADAEAIGLGAGVNLQLGPLTHRLGVRMEVTFDYFLVDDPTTLWEINAELLRDLPRLKHAYVGAGLNSARSGVTSAQQTDLGVNLVGGYKFGSAKATPFVQARLAIGGAEQLYLTGGFRF